MTVQNKISSLMTQGSIGNLGLAAVSSAEAVNSAGKSAGLKTSQNKGFNAFLKNASGNSDSVKADNKGNSKYQLKNDASEKTNGIPGINREQALKKMAGKTGTSSEEIENIPDDVREALQTLIQNVSAELQEILGIDEEQLKSALDALGMTGEDLLYAGSLTELMVEFKADGDFTELISNEEIHSELNLLLNLLEEELSDVAEEFGLTDEQLKLIADKMAEEGKAGINLKQGADMQTPGSFLETSLQEGDKQTLQNAAVSEVTDKSERKSEADGNENGNDGEQFGRNVFREVINNLEENLVAVSDTVDKTEASHIVNQVIEQIQIRAREDMSSMEIQLTPENLGKVNLQVASKNGVVTAHITTDTLAAKEAIEIQISELRNNLNEQGLKVEAVEVTVASHKFESNAEQNKESGQENQNTRRRFIGFEDGDDEQPEDLAEAALVREMMMSNGNRMDIVT